MLTGTKVHAQVLKKKKFYELILQSTKKKIEYIHFGHNIQLFFLSEVKTPKVNTASSQMK